jgi:transposase
VLRLVMALPDPPVTAAPEVTGVDDLALRKGRVYGTVIADAGSRQVIDLLPDREVATWQVWLTARPGAASSDLMSTQTERVHISCGGPAGGGRRGM